MDPSWIVAGLVLLGFELLVPTTYFLWLGASALFTALILFLFPDMTRQMQFVLFSILSVASIVLSKKYWSPKQSVSDQPNLNRRSEQYIGKEFFLSEAIVNGKGKVKVDDSYWQVTGPDLCQGAIVKVVAVDGAVFKVQAKK